MFTKKFFTFLICFFFFIAYSVLVVVRHNSYQSFGFDLGINDQVVWEYSQFKAPITTIDHVPFIPKLFVHIELIYALLAPFYWFWSDVRMLLILQVAVVCFSGIAVFLLAKHYRLHSWIAYALLITYLMFYGVQNALWFDVHSAPFGAAFVLWFIYFLVTKNTPWTVVFFLLAITTKENVAGITFLICVTYYFVTKSKSAIFFGIASVIYLAFVFGIYFPYVAQGYRFANEGGLFSNLDPVLLFNTQEKREVYLYSFLSYGFLPLLSPIYLLPIIGNLASYFILGSSVSTAQGLALQYRIELVPLFTWATIATLARFKRLNTGYTAMYLILCACIVQYVLHLPLSYLTKQYFWYQPDAVNNINTIITTIPDTAAVVSQNNITPHISHRELIFTLYPEKKVFTNNSPCGEATCWWFRWAGEPEYMLVDTSTGWDARHFLANREEFAEAVHNLEKANMIVKYRQKGETTLYKIVKNK